MLKIIDKICKENKANTHENSSEYEADAYALSHGTKPRDLKKGINDIAKSEYKKLVKTTKKLSEKQKEEMGLKQNVKENRNELRRRFKAMDNPEFAKKAKETY